MRILIILLPILFMSVAQAAQVGDMNGDDQIGLTEAIISLQVSAGQNPPIPDSPPGLTECDGKWVDTMNNPEFCGDCFTSCDNASFCNQGECINLSGNRPGTECITDSDCYMGVCQVPDGGSNQICMGPLFRYIFVSSETYTGNLDGLNGADLKCNELASNAGLPGTYKAWLSDSQTAAGDRIVQSEVPYIRPGDENIIADNWADLVDGRIGSVISNDEHGDVVQGNAYAWTNTNTNGTRVSENSFFTCDDWDDTTSYAWTGMVYHLTVWTKIINKSCSESHHLYCVQQL
jgi:Collagenase NC10 and Endostatin